MKKFMSIVILLGVIASGFCMTNTYPMVNIGYSFLNHAKFNDPYDEDSEWGSATIGLKTMDVDVGYPMLFHENRTLFIPAVEYSFIQSYYKHEPENTEHEELHDIQFALRFQRKVGSMFRINAVASPGLSSDLREVLSSDDFIVRGGLSLSVKVSENLSVEAGALYDTPFGKQEILPVLGATWQKDQFYASVVYPKSVDVRWTWNREMTFGLLGTINGYRFNIQNGEPETADEANDSDFQKVDYLEYSRIDLGPIIYWNIFDHFWFDIQTGVTFGKRYKFYDVNEDEMALMDYSSEPAWFMSVTTRYRIPIPE